MRAPEYFQREGWFRPHRRYSSVVRGRIYSLASLQFTAGQGVLPILWIGNEKSASRPIDQRFDRTQLLYTRRQGGSISRIPFRASFPVADHWYATPNNACQVVRGVFTGYLSTWGGELRRKKEQLELTGHSSHFGFVRLQIRWPWCFSSR
jgi:hypothetical protein